MLATDVRPDRFEGLVAVDYGGVALYLAAMLLLGYSFKKQQKSSEEYFVASRGMPWFVVGLSIFATLLSTVSYLSNPGEIIKHGPGILGGYLHLPLTIAVVSMVLIPFLMRYRLTSAYGYLEKNYGLRTRLFASCLFIIIRLVWMGMIVFTASMALAKITNLNFEIVVLGVGCIAIVYTVMGGMRAVIWTDVAQFVILLAGLIFTVVYVFWDTGTGPLTWFQDLAGAEKEPQPLFSLDPYTRVSLVGIAVYGFFWWTCTAGSDQVAIQRYLTTGSVVAALFSAAMSSMDSGIHGVATVITVDFVQRIRKNTLSPQGEVKLARLITVVTGVCAIGFCLFLHKVPEETRGNLYDMASRVSGYLAGALGGIFFIAFLKLRCSGQMVIASALLGAGVGFYLALGYWFVEHPDVFIYVDPGSGTQQRRWEPNRGEESTIGSDLSRNRYVLSGPGVKKEHLVIRFERGWKLESLTFDAWTTLNGNALTSPEDLNPDDVIRVGSHSLVVRKKVISFMWALPSACLVTLFSAFIFSLWTRWKVFVG